MLKVMTPGPTQVRANVLAARAQAQTNPDLDPAFFDFYRDTCSLASHLLHSSGQTLILGGEGILGLEAACASLTQPGDRVLVIDNGVFGKGFADFVRLYGGEPVLFTTDYHRAVPSGELADFLERDHDFAYATLVHCDTPSGVLNDVSALCPLLKDRGILTVVDSVSASFGEPVRADDWGIDVLCGGSQKVLSSPPGLTLVTLSDAARQAMARRKTPIPSFYANLTIFQDYYEKQWFPYTMPIHDIHGLRQALENIAADTGILERHAALASAVRQAIVLAGLQLHLKSGYSSTVTVFNVPESTTAAAILERMKTVHGILLAGSFDILAGQVLRIGHMGENANPADLSQTLAALAETLTFLGVPLKADPAAVFNGLIAPAALDQVEGPKNQ